MRLACVYIPRFALAIERQLNPRLLRVPAIVHVQNRVLEVSPELSEAYPEQSLRQARAAYPNAVFVPANLLLYRDVSAAMLQALGSLSPVVELAEQGCAFLDTEGLDRLHPSVEALASAILSAVHEATGLLPAVGIGDGKFVARVAVWECGAGETKLVPQGQERAFLAGKSVSLLPFPQTVIEHLHALALHRLGDIAELLRTAVEAQYRSMGRRMWELANGIDREPLRPHRAQESLAERLTFDSPVVANEALIMASRQLLRCLVGRLDRRSASSMRMQVLAGERLLWERREIFREPTSDEGRMAFIARTRLASLVLTEAADTVVVTLSGIGREAARQAKLVTETNLQTESLAGAIHQIHTRYGRPMVWRAVEVDPCSRHPEDRDVLIPYDA